MRRFLCFSMVMLIVLAVCSCAFAEYYNEGHMGTETDPYVIDTNADLVMLRDRVNAGSESEDKYYRLTQNLTLSQYTDWEPIGTEKNPFTGHFDGNNLAIQININKSWKEAGLFGIVSTAENTYAVKNLGVSGSVRGKNAGGIIVLLNSGNVESCSFNGTVQDGSASDGATMGSIVSYMAGGAVKNCSSSGNVVSSYTYNDSKAAGGIAAYMTGGSIENCTSSTNIEILSRHDSSLVGGIVGYAQIADFEAIKDCTFSGNVSCKRYAGGIGGYVSGGNLQNNRVTGNTNGQVVIFGAYASGGIAGRIGDSTTLENCEVSSIVIVSGDSKSEAIGGVVGIMNASTVRDNQSYATIRGNITNMGGVVGKLDAASYTISNNRYSNAEHGIGNNAQGVPSEEGCIKIGTSISITTSSPLPNATAESSYSVTLRTDSASAVTWALANGTSLPEGLTLNSSAGTISGTPKTAGTYRFVIQAIPAAGASATKEFTLTVNAKSSTPTPTPNPSSDITPTPTPTPNPSSDVAPAPEQTTITITTTELPYGIEDEYYSYRLEANVSGLTWSVSSGYLPYGLELDSSTGTIYGIPTYYGTYSFTVTAGNSSARASKSFTLYIYEYNYDYDYEYDYDYDRRSAGESKGGGGCNSGFGLMGMAAIIFLKRKAR